MSNERFGTFTERANRVLTLAQEEATCRNHGCIDTEHVLLGLLRVREREGVAARVLSNLGVELNRVRSAMEFIIGRGDRMIVGEVGLTSPTKKVIELAVDEARRLGHHDIGTEHLLLDLVREGEGIAAGVLESLGVNLAKARAETLKVLKQGQAGERRERPSQPRATFTMDAPREALMPLQLDPVVDQVIWKLEPLLAQRSQRVRKAYSFVPDVLADTRRIEQVLVNVLVNASEYSVEGDELIIDAVVRGDAVLVSVEDHGRGIDPQDRSHIFERFYRGGHTTASTSRAGLGLAIVRTIVEAHKGHVGVEDVHPHGTLFWFTLSLA
jgi:signal transduction histidine kinase